MSSYYYIKVEDDIRCEKAFDAKEACRKAYGTEYTPLVGQHYTSEFPCPAKFKNVGTRNPRYWTAAERKKYESQTWIPLWPHKETEAEKSARQAKEKEEDRQEEERAEVAYMALPEVERLGKEIRTAFMCGFSEKKLESFPLDLLRQFRDELAKHGAELR